MYLPRAHRGGSRMGLDDMHPYYGGGMYGYNDSNYVYVDAHVLGSPVLADVNNDGQVEVKIYSL